VRKSNVDEIFGIVFNHEFVLSFLLVCVVLFIHPSLSQQHLAINNIHSLDKCALLFSVTVPKTRRAVMNYSIVTF
jgi:hypothetical protein